MIAIVSYSSPAGFNFLSLLIKLSFLLDSLLS